MRHESAKSVQPSQVRAPARWRRWGLWLGLIGLIAALFHAPLCRLLASQLVVSEAAVSPSAVVALSGDRCYDVAAEWSRQHPELQLLVVQPRRLRLEQLGLRLDHAQEFRQELRRRGVPDTALGILPGNSDTLWDDVTAIRSWLQTHRDSSVLLLCDAFHTRRLRMMVDQLLEEPQRVAIHPLPDRRHDVTNWWTSRAGIRDFLYATISLCDTVVRGRPEPLRLTDWSPDAYEAALTAPAAPSAIPAEKNDWRQRAAEWLDISEPPLRVDHVLLLPGEENSRPFVAAALVRAGLARDILFPRNFPSPQEEDGIVGPIHEISLAVLKLRDIPDESVIVLDEPSDSTIGDGRAARAALAADPTSTVAVVTNGYHTRRARIVMRSVFGEDAERFHFIAAPTDLFSASDWWKSEVGTLCIVSEYFKLTGYWIQYADGKYWLAGSVLVLFLLKWRRSRHQKRVAANLAKTVQ
ncbi:ElyC/SanA/YdcF family protein [Planctomicrobium sp. SH664]|uniref:ElyC/SanA/YdcF family protein n=1 Tax=Planctomicrobium sp. SH664 TaxID=3448125 RepID=UPI003F5C2716